ncbi:Trafficking protein particle complex subunit 11 [Linum perenne]
MDEYPEELRTPPVSLIALVGCPELHALISSHLHAEQPPINTLALPDFSKVSVIFSDTKPPSSSTDPNSVPLGILKRDWLLKHRTKVPAVLAALFTSEQISGDPAQWLQVCTDLENLRNVMRPKNIKLVIVVVVPPSFYTSSSDEIINEDRMAALRKRAELDAKNVVFFNSGDELQLKESLNKLAASLVELAATYYREEGRRIKALVEKKNINSIQLNIRCCFKVAVYAEFRRDWAEALRFYDDAYHMLRQMVSTANSLPVIQRLVEIKIVAEQLHFKISTLLLHGGKIADAISWFRKHNTSYRNLIGPPEAILMHWEWMSRQFLVFAELLETSSKAIQSISGPAVNSAEKFLTEWEFQPAYYYQLAAHYLKEKRIALELAQPSSGAADGTAESVVPSVYVGQFARLLEQEDALVMQPLTDEEYILYAIAEGKRFQDSFEIIALLKKSHESFSSIKATRMGSLCALQMAKEYYTVGDFTNAKPLLDGVASLYRSEGWVTLLWEVLGYLRECSRKVGMVKEFVEYSLEMAALPVSSDTGVLSFGSKDCGPAGPTSLAQRENIHKEVFSLVSGGEGSVSDGKNSDLQSALNGPLHLEIDLVSPLRVVLLASVAFHEQIIKPGMPALMTVSLLSQLPMNVDIDQLEFQFNQSECNFVIINSERPASDGHQGRRVESAPSLSLITNKWLRLTYAVQSEMSGKLECIYVIAKMRSHLTICCRAESPASMDDLTLWRFEDRVQTFPTKDPALAFSGQKAAQVEEHDPQVDLVLGATGPALVEECFVVPVTVTSKGHSVFSGELKINLVDVKGGGLFSPREVEPLSSDSHHVQLLGVSMPEKEEDPQVASSKIKKIQQSFGLVSVPFLKDGESWSCKLEIRWNRPKPIMLFVSLGYFSDVNELSSQKVHVHKSLQIDGKTGIVISHHFMLPFHKDPLLLSRIKPTPDSKQLPSLPMNETTVLVVSAKNSCEVPLQLKSVSIDMDDDHERSYKLQHGGGEDLVKISHLMPGEEFRKVFTITPEVKSSSLILGSACVRWRRKPETEDDQSTSTAAEACILTKSKLPEVNVELPPLVVRQEWPPYAILGDPFAYIINIKNQSKLLQEVKFSLADAQNFVLSGSHTDTVFILPSSERVVSYKIVPLCSGMQQLPRVTVTSVRYSAAFQPSVAASTVFVFPSKPHFQMSGNKVLEAVSTE